MKPGRISNLSEDLAREIRERIVDARMHAGARINEVKLAAELEVSRTPLREALTRLVAEGALDSIPRRGFFVRSLTTSEFCELYDIRPILDPEALRLAGIPSPKDLTKLDQLNDKLRRAKTVERALGIDDKWHLTLVAGCPNRLLVQLIEQFMARTRRYEMALMGNPVNVMNACDEHARIVADLRERKLAKACRQLKQNLQSGKEPILTWLRKRIKTAGTPHKQQGSH